VLLVEPQPEFAGCLRRTFSAALASGKAKVVEKALGAGDGRGGLDVSAGALAAVVRVGPAGPVEIASLDSLLEGARVDFLKADVEGAEHDLLAGAQETLARWHPRIAITVYHDENDWRDLLALSHRAYSGYRYELSGITQHGKPVLLRLWADT
jgi:FkbM family methyltransferase